MSSYVQNQIHCRPLLCCSKNKDKKEICTCLVDCGFFLANSDLQLFPSVDVQYGDTEETGEFLHTEELMVHGKIKISYDTIHGMQH